MSKKTNTLWFILGATVFNVLITIICFIVLFIVYMKYISPLFPEGSSAAGWGLAVIFIGAIALSFVIYRVILKQIVKKVDMEKHFDPLFNARRNLKR
ncbi:hypothetical protein FACS1894147_08640 [Spirochaetia bacterium]|nr:hypothetical protein FACS1894147_08640 [Spirochaetia bacterium]